ncbi:unnamed protein product, partial [Amoebophrya sp. A25]
VQRLSGEKNIVDQQPLLSGKKHLPLIPDGARSGDINTFAGGSSQKSAEAAKVPTEDSVPEMMDHV